MGDTRLMKLKNFLKQLKTIFRTATVFIILLWMVIFYHQKQIFIVSGPSMYPTLKNGQRILASRYFDNISYNEIIIFKKDNEILIKRVTGMEGNFYTYATKPLGYSLIVPKFDRAKDTLYIKIKKIPHDYYYVSGDNYMESTDSKDFGLIPKSSIIAVYN